MVDLKKQKQTTRDFGISIFLVLAMVLWTPNGYGAEDVTNVDLTGASYPEGALLKSNQEEIRERMQLEILERQAQQARDRYTAQRADTEKRVAENKRKIDDYKTKQEKRNSELRQLNMELSETEQKSAEVQKELSVVGNKASEELAHFEETKSSLEKTKMENAASLRMLQVRKDSTRKLIETSNQRMGQYEDEIRRLQTETLKSQDLVNEYEKIALDVKGKVGELQSQLEVVRVERNRADQERQLSKESLAEAQRQYSGLLAETKKAEKERDVALKALDEQKKIYVTEMRRLEEKTAQANVIKAIAEAERVRFDNEADRMKVNVATVRDESEALSVNGTRAQESVMRSRIALSHMRQDLVRQITDKEARGSAVVREVASASPPSPAGETGELTLFKITSASCKMRRTPSATSEFFGSVKRGESYSAEPASKGYMKIEDGGKTFYVDKDCGSF